MSLIAAEYHACRDCMHARRKLSLMYHPDKAAADQKEIAQQLYDYIRAAFDDLG